ncbi:hypothetical protein PIROE2DRAFT_64496 [Piromyces sp. E2]|nr:hypothetical protein PIROE2DRAFT_64496 [Piromyces sp. E2]|eukprot:OUM58316.1 hypothetical protein PIROE2DRAFT_64496 [Piromyces sp. E2]
MCYDANKIPSKNCLGGWFYRVNVKTAEENAAFAKSHGWNYVLLSSNVNSENARQRLIRNVKAFRAQDIAVHIMCLEDTVYIDDPETAYNEIASILKFVNEQQLDIQGIHIDCEPHGREDWKTASVEERNVIFNNFLKVVENGRNAINDVRPNTTYSAAVAWWYSSKAKQSELQYGRGYDIVRRDRLDIIIPMIYDGAGGTVERVISRSEDYITDKAATVIGIAVEDYEYGLFKNITQEITNIRGGSDYFYGISVYANQYYPDWN